MGLEAPGRLTLKLVAGHIPGARPVSAHSLFSSIEGAATVDARVFERGIRNAFASTTATCSSRPSITFRANTRARRRAKTRGTTPPPRLRGRDVSGTPRVRRRNRSADTDDARRRVRQRPARSRLGRPATATASANKLSPSHRGPLRMVRGAGRFRRGRARSTAASLNSDRSRPGAR